MKKKKKPKFGDDRPKKNEAELILECKTGKRATNKIVKYRVMARTLNNYWEPYRGKSLGGAKKVMNLVGLTMSVLGYKVTEKTIRYNAKTGEEVALKGGPR